jgi:hypothetical protein
LSTYKNRFDEFDKYSIRIIADQNLEKIFILDTAISDGRASCYFLEESIKQLQNLWYTGSDINVDYYLKKKNSAGKYYIVTDKSNKIIEITLPPFVWNLARTEGSFYFLNNFLKSYFSRKSRNELVKNEFKYTEKIELIHPDYRKLIKCDNCFQVRNYNLFEKVTEKYNVIRAMNIIHPGYFSRDQLILILSNLYEGLEMNGLLIEGSNENVGSPVEGAIYKKVGNGFLLICEPERPSRIRELVLGFSPKRQYE